MMKFDAQGNSKPDIYDHFTNECKKNKELEQHISDLERFIADLANDIEATPTCITDDSYAAQVDMRKRIVDKIRKAAEQVNNDPALPRHHP
jgi:cell division septum initiation protein DivIVA